MARLNVNPTRMELKRLKGRLSTATRGHKLLKDKSDEMIRRFSVIIRENKALRTRIEDELKDCLGQFAFARGTASKQEFDKAFSMPTSSVKAEYKFGDVMGVTVPSIVIESEKKTDGFPYAFAEISSEADYSVKRISSLIADLLKLAEVEKTAAMLSIEIERNKRRVNALEYIMIPQIEETIAYIRSKLDENERAATTRLMKVKSMLADAD